MAKRIVQMHDKHKSTTNLYPKVTMGSLSPQVKAYIESQGSQGETTPIITITQEQEIETNTYLLTEEQYQLIVNNAYKNIIVSFNGNNVLMFIGNGNSQGSYALTHIDYIDEELIIKQCYIVVMPFNNDKVLSFNNDTFTKTKQLYQHNVYIQTNSDNNYGWGCYTISIITDFDTLFTYELLTAYLKSYGYDNASTKKIYCNVRGSHNDTVSIKNPIGIFSTNGTSLSVLYTDGSNTGIGSIRKIAIDSGNFVDTVAEIIRGQ